MASSNIREARKRINSIADKELRSGIIRYVTSSSVPLEYRQRLLSAIEVNKQKISWEVYPGYYISADVMNIIKSRDLSCFAFTALQVVLDGHVFRDGEENNKDVFTIEPYVEGYRVEMYNRMKRENFPFKETDFRNTRFKAAIDSLILFGGYCFTKSRIKGETSSSGRRQLKAITVPSAEYLTPSQRYDLVEMNLKRMETEIEKG